MEADGSRPVLRRSLSCRPGSGSTLPRGLGSAARVHHDRSRCSRCRSDCSRWPILLLTMADLRAHVPPILLLTMFRSPRSRWAEIRTQLLFESIP